jgi:hypothetical protein
MAKFAVLFRHLSGGTEEGQKKPQTVHVFVTDFVFTLLDMPVPAPQFTDMYVKHNI